MTYLEACWQRGQLLTNKREHDEFMRSMHFNHDIGSCSVRDVALFPVPHLSLHPNKAEHRNVDYGALASTQGNLRLRNVLDVAITPMILGTGYTVKQECKACAEMHQFNVH